MKKYYAVFLFFIAGSFALTGQNKPPVAVDDFMTAICGQSNILPVTHNDAAFNGHRMMIFGVFQPANGTCNKNDHTIVYESDPDFTGTDSLRYVIKDMVNGLTDTATVYLEVIRSGVDTLDVNNIRAQFTCFGLNFKGDWKGAFEVPAGSGIYTIYASSLWLTARDNADSLYVASAYYNSKGADYFPGPVMNRGSYSQQTDLSWTRNWKINYRQVIDHRNHWQEPGYLMPDVLSLWPAHGYIAAGQLQKIAPFADVNSNGIYEPALGEYPEIKGDQAICCIYNDDRYPHTHSFGGKLGVEVHAMYYALDQPEDSALWNTVFEKLWIINRSQNHYHDFYCGVFNDFDLGFSFDDFYGTDTLLNAVFAYNGDSFDGMQAPAKPGQYGFHPPAQGMQFLNQRLNSSLCYGVFDPVPEVPEQYEYALKGFWSDGSPLTFGGNGHGGTEIVKHIYPGNPGDPDQWTEISAMNIPGEFRSVASAGPYELLPGDTLMLELAYVWARDYDGTNVSSVHLLKERMAAVRDWYGNMLSTEETIPVFPSVSVNPNPFNDRISFKLDNHDSGHYIVIDISGRSRLSGTFTNGTADIDAGFLQPGLYFLHIEQKDKSTAKKLVKNL